MSVKIIDLFAGPGGLGEGFSSCRPQRTNPFEIAMSVENEYNAHKTLTLRALYRRLTNAQRKTYYYPYICCSNEKNRDHRFQNMIEHCKEKWEAALIETLGSPHALGNPLKWKKIRNGEPLDPADSKSTEQEKTIFKRLSEIVKSHDGPIVVIGGPPCQAYSGLGRIRNRAEKNYNPENDERFFLYQEYLKVIDKAKPDIFVMENVEGILTAKFANGERVFEQIKQELIRPKNRIDERYDVYSLSTYPQEPASNEFGPLYMADNDYVLKASDYGVPQDRKRVILLGIKKKYGPVNTILRKVCADQVPCTEELIGHLPKLRSGLNDDRLSDTRQNWDQVWDKSYNSLLKILRSPKEINRVAKRWVRIRLKLKGNLGLGRREQTQLEQELEEEIRSAYERTAIEIEKLNSRINQLAKTDDGRGCDFFVKTGVKSRTFSREFELNYPGLFKWLSRDKHLGGVINHRTRKHMASDLKRYLFSAAWTEAHSHQASSSPKSKDYPFAISPEHNNWESGNHADRFRTIGSTTVPLTITSHLRKDGHAQIHFDPTQNRSMTAREAARIQTFPDDYFFEGKQGAQFQQVGNAVPSYLAKAIALHVIEIMEDKGII